MTRLARSAVAIAFAALLSTLPVVAEAATPVGAPPDTAAIPLNLDHAPKPTRINIPAERAAGDQSSCETVKTNLEEYQRQGKQTVSCVELRQKAAAPAETAARSVWCEGADQGFWISRREGCYYQQILWNFYAVPSGEIVGQAIFTIRQEIETHEDPGSPYWTEYAGVTMDDAWGVATSGKAEITEQCQAPCRMTNTSAWDGQRTIGIGETLEGDFENSWIPAGFSNRMTMSYRMTFFGQGTIASNPFNWSSPQLRCDHDPTTGNINAGCVWPDFYPQLRLPVSRFGEGALTVAVGNYYLQSGFGYLQPLTRLADDGLAEANRRIVCEDGTFGPIFADDTCDEYAFARTYQSGPFFGVHSGLECAEVYFLNNGGGQWGIYPVRTFYGNEACVRGHVPGQQNSAVGGAYSALIRTERLLNGDPFYAYAVN